MKKQFGNIHMKGYDYIKHAVTLETDSVMDLYREIGKHFNVTPENAMRGITLYKQKVIKEHGIEKVCKILEYPVGNLSNHEFILLIKELEHLV